MKFWVIHGFVTKRNLQYSAYTGGRVGESSQRECGRVHKEGEDLRQQGNALRTICKGRFHVVNVHWYIQTTSQCCTDSL